MNLSIKQACIFFRRKEKIGTTDNNCMSNIIEWTKGDIGDLLENTLDCEKRKKNMCNCRDSNAPYDQPVTELRKK